MTYYAWLQDYFQNRAKSERLGQAFCNDFIKNPWPKLYYETDQSKAEQMIVEWLTNFHYVEHMPEKVGR